MCCVYSVFCSDNYLCVVYVLYFAQIIICVCCICCVIRVVTPADFPQLEQVVKKAVKDKQPFERLEMTKEDLLRMFEVIFTGTGCG